MAKKIVELANVHAEYEYVKNIRCKKCGGEVNAERQGGGMPVGEGQNLRMHDDWTITCRKCKKKEEITLSVPSPLAAIGFDLSKLGL